MNKQQVQRFASRAWEGLAPDVGSDDGVGALDHLDAVVATMIDLFPLGSRECLLLASFNPEIMGWVKEELRKYG